MNDCEKGVRYVDFTGGVELFEVRLNDDGSNPECIKNLGKVCLALTITLAILGLIWEVHTFSRLTKSSRKLTDAATQSAQFLETRYTS